MAMSRHPRMRARAHTQVRAKHSACRGSLAAEPFCTETKQPCKSRGWRDKGAGWKGRAANGLTSKHGPLPKHRLRDAKLPDAKLSDAKLDAKPSAAKSAADGASAPGLLAKLAAAATQRWTG